VEGTLRDEFVNRPPCLKQWIELDQRLWPENAPVEFLLDVFLDGRLANLNKALNVRRIITDELVIKIKKYCSYAPLTRLALPR
jgi:hypothetical protein